MITKEKLQSIVDFDEVDVRVAARLNAIQTKPELMQFMIEYASWNGAFANGVTHLAGLIGSLRECFMEPGLPYQLADRSNLVASYVFDAARDEYDDSINTGRDPHRSLAQATLAAMASELGLAPMLHERDAEWLTTLNQRVMLGYHGPAGTLSTAFIGLGYHLGSELLADCEFSIIDDYMREDHYELTQRLMRSTVEIGGVRHRGYAWIGIHSGHGGGVEAEHFEAAVEGVNAALSYVHPDLEAREKLIQLVYQGFKEFNHDHHTFFKMYSAPRGVPTGWTDPGARA